MQLAFSDFFYFFFQCCFTSANQLNKFQKSF